MEPLKKPKVAVVMGSDSDFPTVKVCINMLKDFGVEGVLSAYTPLPVIGIPLKSSTLDGLDSLLSVVQMPPGIPVATVAVDGAENAALLAVQILSLGYNGLREAMKQCKKKLAEKVAPKDNAVKEQVKGI